MRRNATVPFHILLCTLVFFSSMLMSCSEEQGNWSAVQQRDEYVYGVWQSLSAKKAAQTMRDLSKSIKHASAPLEPSSTSGDTLQTTVPPDQLLPSDGELSGWVQSRPPSTYQGLMLYRDRAISAELYHAYGFQQQAEVEYETPQFGSRPLILLEIFDMGTPENAFGIYSFHTYPQMKFEWVGSKAMLSGNYLRFSKGRYFIQIEGYEIATGIRDGMVTLAKIIAAEIKDPPPKPRVLSLLPNTNKVQASVKLFRSNWVLRQIYSTLPVNVPQLTEAAVGISARYRENTKSKTWMDTYVVFIIRFTDTATAESVHTRYQDAVMKGAVPFEVNADGAILVNEGSAP